MRFKGFVGELIGFLLVALALSVASVYVVARIGRMDVRLRRQANEVKALRELVLRQETLVPCYGVARAPARVRVIATSPRPIVSTCGGSIPNREPQHFFSVCEVIEPSPKKTPEAVAASPTKTPEAVAASPTATPAAPVATA